MEDAYMYVNQTNVETLYAQTSNYIHYSSNTTILWRVEANLVT